MKKIILILIALVMLLTSCDILNHFNGGKVVDDSSSTKEPAPIEEPELTIPIPNYWSQCDSWFDLEVTEKNDYPLDTDVFSDGSGSYTHKSNPNGVFGNCIQNSVTVQVSSRNYRRRYDSLTMSLIDDEKINKQGTLMFWARSTFINRDGYNNSPNTELLLTVTNSSNRYFSSKITTYDNFNLYISGLNPIKTDSNWHLYIFVWDLDGFNNNYKVKIYIDGSLVGAMNNIPVDILDFDKVMIRFGVSASYTTGNTAYLYVDNIMFWDKALPVDSIASEDDLVGYFYKQKLEFPPEWFESK